MTEGSTRSDSSMGNKTPCAADLDLEHVPDACRDYLRKMWSKYGYMSDGSLGEINVVKHQIDLKIDAKPTMRRPCRTGPAFWKVASDEVERML